MRNNKRQFVGAFVMAAMMSAALPLSASSPKLVEGGRDTCTFMYGVLVMKASLPQAVQDLIVAVFGCEGNWG